MCSHSSGIGYIDIRAGRSLRRCANLSTSTLESHNCLLPPAEGKVIRQQYTKESVGKVGIEMKMCRLCFQVPSQSSVFEECSAQIFDAVSFRGSLSDVHSLLC